MKHDNVSVRGRVLWCVTLAEVDHIEKVHTTGLLSQSCYNMDDYYYYTGSSRGLSSRSFVPNDVQDN